ncbi:methylglyoxal synthase [Peptoniphilus duerdenii]|uniref:methylglyoxal synthase n=1 Tax=Peptoniphilus duerdenii TaxID=507750 RepID=UPI002805A4D3|nr:methylglyoxal synthase [Peptoniphilus duerdenii]
MEVKKIKVNKKKNIALVAHDHKKKELLDWVKKHEEKLKGHNFIGTGTTATLISRETSLDVNRLVSGPLGGDLQLGAKISDLEIDILVFFWDPLEAQPHDPDVKALLRIATLYNIAMATSPTTGDYILSSPMFNEEYEVEILDNEYSVEHRILKNKFD